MDLPKRYDPDQVEERIYDYWEEGNFFHAEIERSKEPFSMAIPPPNVTSELHVGHALQFTLHDIVIRYQRMKGKVACWFPGMDHAGIATQNVVEKQLRKEGLTRHDLGREEFVSRVWDWKEKYGGEIKDQLKSLGASPDWSRERFTLDEGLSRAVREAFVRLYEEGYIYRDEYIINWCPRCSTALSNIEVDHEEESGKLYWIRYQLRDSEEELTVATTRPETMLGDTALAVHPDDGRAEELVGRTAILPLVGREIPVVSDEEVDPDFGSGVVKVTPAHDPLDFQIGENLDLELIKVIDRDAKISFPGQYEGLDRYEARERIVEDLRQEGKLEEIEDYEHSVGHCQRCDTVVEPQISKQWFVRMEELAQPAIEAVREDDVQLIPERWKKVYFEWMENIEDWCISRQLWWGHRIPAWHCADCGAITVSRDTPERCRECGGSNINQETDVLDTWFSSSLWPFSVMGWPEETEELDYFFPTDLLITGFDIIFFWVARMILTSLHFMDDVPFEQVLLTPLVLDEDGQKMSSSKGNILDPLEIKEEFGADPLRFTMSSSTTKGRGMKISKREIEDNRNFMNKIWNAARFALSHLEGDEEGLPPKEDLRLEDRWIISRYQKTIEEVEQGLENYSFKNCSNALYSFIWGDFCDWYLELVKVRLYSEDEGENRVARRVMAYVFRGWLRLLHPFTPFITEEIWGKLNEGKGSGPIMYAEFPQLDKDRFDEEAEEEIAILQEMINAVRSVRAEMNVPEGEETDVLVKTEDPALARLAEEKEIYFRELADVGQLVAEGEPQVPENTARRVLEEAEVLVPLGDVIDVEEELGRIRSELEEVEDDLQRTLRKLNDEDFLTKAPEEIVEKEKEKRDEFKDRIARLKNSLKALGGDRELERS